jgi:hypothetical protein
VADYVIRVRRSRRRIGQRFWVTIQAGNGEPLFRSEMLKDRRYALELGARFTAKLEGNLVDET